MKLLWYVRGKGVGGNVYTLYDTQKETCIGRCQLILDGESGFGLPEIDSSIEMKINEPGARFLTSRLLPRKITFDFKLHGQYDNLMTARRTFANWFTPENPWPSAPYEGHLVRDLGSQRLTRCRCRSLPFEVIDTEVDEIRLKVELDAFDALFADSEYEEETVTATGVTMNDAFTLANTGEWFVQPDVWLYGPMTDPVIENETDGTKLEIDGTINVGQTRKFVLDDDEKQFIDPTLFTDYMGLVTPDSDVETFGLLSPPQTAAENGDNAMRITAAATQNGVTAVKFRWHKRYLTA